MKVGDLVYCKKDFYSDIVSRDFEDLSQYPEHAFKLGEKYRIFAIDKTTFFKNDHRYFIDYLIEIDDAYVEYFLLENDYNQLTDEEQKRIFNFNEYFCESLKDFRKIKLDKLNSLT